MKTIICVILTLMLHISVSGCASREIIGPADHNAAVAVLDYGYPADDPDAPSGVIYRRVNSPERLVASSRLLLIAFLDNNPPSNNSIPFLETLSESFSEEITVVIVDTYEGFGDDNTEYMKGLFDIEGYPWFAIVSRGAKLREFAGYDPDIAEEIILKISELAYR